MLETPFIFQNQLTPFDFQRLGELSLRWSHIEHIIGNCLRVMLRLSPEEAIVAVFPLGLEQRLKLIRKLKKLSSLNQEALDALAQLEHVMPGIQFVRNSVAHAILIRGDDGDQVFHLRSKKRSLTKDEIFSSEELTNYAAHAALSLRYALGMKGHEGARHPLPEKPAIPEFLREMIPIRN